MPILTPDIDDPLISLSRKNVIKNNYFLRQYYIDCYNFFRSIHVPNGPLLEIGAGPGFMRDYFPSLISSDFLRLPGLDLILSGTDLPFATQSLSGIFLHNVMHHLPDLNSFFHNTIHCLKPGGVIAVIEPANTLWGRFLYSNFHHENFDPHADSWSLPKGGPMSIANGALPWIVFLRDRNFFLLTFPSLTITYIDFFCPLLYLISGGFSHRPFLPDSAYNFIKWTEKLLYPFRRHLGIFMKVILEKRQ